MNSTVVIPVHAKYQFHTLKPTRTPASEQSIIKMKLRSALRDFYNLIRIMISFGNLRKHDDPKLIQSLKPSTYYQSVSKRWIVKSSGSSQALHNYWPRDNGGPSWRRTDYIQRSGGYVQA